MPKITNTEIKDLGFRAEMFKYTSESLFDTFIDAVIAEQAKILEGRIGSTTYDSATSPAQDYVKRAEKALAAAEMVGRRINLIFNNVVGAGTEISTKHEENQLSRYLAEAEMWIKKIIAGAAADAEAFSAGVLETTHFESTATIGGLEIT